MIYRVQKAVPTQPHIIRIYVEVLELDEISGADYLSSEYELAIPIDQIPLNIDGEIDTASFIENIKVKIKYLERASEICRELEEIEWTI